MNMDVLQQYAKLDAEKKELDDALKAVKKKREALLSVVLNELAMDGVQSVSLRVGGRDVKVYVHTSKYPAYKDGMDRDTLIDALKRHEETAFLVQENYNTTSFAAWLREQDREGRIPEEIASIVDIAEKHDVHVIKA